MRKSWRSELAEGRVFELRSQSKRYPAPCALAIDLKASWNQRAFVAVDKYGVIGHGAYTRSHNPDIYVDGLRLEQFNGSRIQRRRRDLERFDADDLALIRYGHALDFTGRIHDKGYSDMSIPPVISSEWTVFWLPAWKEGDYRWLDSRRERKLEQLLSGAWYFECHGGSRHLGYKHGCTWATRHSGDRLEQIRQHLQSQWGSALIEQPVKIAKWTDGKNVYTEEVRRECPALGSRIYMVQYQNGMSGFSIGHD